MGNYAQCMLLLPECKRLHVLPKNQLQALEQKLYLQTLQEHILNDELDTINSFIDKLPKELSNDSAIQTTYADYLIRKQQDITAETILRKGLQIKLDDAMLDLYGQLTAGCAERTFIVKLLKKQPNNGRLWLCLAQIDTKNSLWGQAIHAFESSIQAQPTPQAYAGLATLFEQLNDKEQALKIYRAGLDLVLCKTLVNTLD
jgi:HemY protein